MKTLNVVVLCEAWFQSEIQVPDDMTLDEAIDYAKDHIDEIKRGDLTYVPFSGELSEEECEFEED